MAYTSVIPVRRLDWAVKYVMNKEKTTAVSLQDALDYAANRDKTEQSYFESSYACTLEKPPLPICAKPRSAGISRAVCRDTTLYKVLQQERSHPNLRIGLQKNLQTVCLADGMNMSSAHT